jgi:hypothetical protein
MSRTGLGGVGRTEYLDWGRFRARHVQILPSRDDGLRRSETRPVSGVSASSLHREQPPGTRNTLEFVLASVVELETRPCHKVDDGARRQYLTRFRHLGHARADVDGDPTDVVVHKFYFSGVKATSHVDA